MEKAMKNMTKAHLPVAVCALWLLAASSAQAADPADARFKDTGKADPIRITNISCKPSDAKGAGTITFDLAWDWSWRAAWEVAPEQSGGKGKLSLENWDAAWVFIKFRKPGADGWSHATLSTNASDHTVPAGATLDVGLNDDPSTGIGTGGRRGLGVFICRNAPGRGPNDWKGMKVRWLCDADGVPNPDKVVVAGDREARAPQSARGAPKDDMEKLSEPQDDPIGRMFEEANAKAEVNASKTSGTTEIRIFAIRMVYVPEGAFWAGDGSTNGVAGQFSSGNTTAPFRVESEAALTLGGADRGNLGNRDNVFSTDDFSVSQTRFLPSAFPKGFEPFYCMRDEVTRGEMTALLNTLSSAQQAAMKDFVGEKENAGKRGITLAGAGRLAKYEAAAPHVACDGLAWRDALAFSAWAGLRPMTELEFEKACRGPIQPVSDEFAWGTATTNIVTDSDRARGGASYWGILDLTGNLVENTVAIGRPIGRQFDGAHGEGRVGDLSEWDDFAACFKNENRRDILAGRPGWWMLGGGMIWRGATNWLNVMRVSDRSSLTHIALSATRPASCGFRAVRSVGVGQPQSATSEGTVRSDSPQSLFNEQLRIANVTLQPGDGKTATITFDIGWNDSWRNATNHDAAWVFFKARTVGGTNWTHVKLVADQVLNPTGYGQESGSKLDFVVPDGPEGFTGVFLQRAAPGTGPLSAKGVTVVCDLSDTRHSTLDTPHLQAFGIEMVYVPEGPFYLGSGGTEPNRFYQYTDGSQDALPYPVTDAGSIPTGPQEGRLWATGVQPDGSDAGEIPAAFPNGFRAFYCMKYQLKMGQFAGFLGMQSEVRSFYHACKPGNGMSVAKVAWAFLQGVTWENGIAFGAWAGLRPMTELEFEKAWRGPRKPVPDEIGPGYWGIRELASDGLVQRMVSVGRPDGLQFAGTHGGGSTSLPKDWPQGRSPAIAQRGDDWDVRPSYGDGLAGTRPSIRRRVWAEGDTDSWRGVRTAPALAAVAKPGTGGGGFKLELLPLPAMGDLDVAVFHLAGRFHNAGDQALSVELVSPLPDACFPDGAASRAFTAAPKTATAFKILMVVSRQTARVVRRVQSFPVSVRKKDGEVLAEATAKLILSDPLLEKPAVIGTFDGGKVTVRVSNGAGQPQALTIELQPPPEIVMSETSRRIDVPAGETVVSPFAASRRDASVVEGFYRIPYRVVPANGAAQTGVAAVEVRLQSHWWVRQHEIKTGGLTLDAGVDFPDGGAGDVDLGIAGLDTPKANPADAAWNVDSAGVFKAGGLPKGWQTVTHGAGLWPRALKPLPKGKTIISAATRVIAPTDRAAILTFGFETDGWTWLDGTVLATIDSGSGPGFYPPPMRVWINGEVVRDSRPGAKSPVPKTIPLKKGANTMLIQFETGPDGKGQLPHLFALFHDAKDGAPILDLSYDMEVKP
jgi:formylglycine-generating enzyme required for sulfatase activity